MRVVVLADTHIRRGGSRRLPEDVHALLQDAEAILHAGDVVVGDLLHELAGVAPVSAVVGNNDEEQLARSLPVTRVENLAGVRVGMIHDSGPSRGRAGRMRHLFPDCSLVVYGHSHVPFDGAGIDGQRLFNPGSPTERRSQPNRTVGLLDLHDGEVRHHEIRVVG